MASQKCNYIVHSIAITHFYNVLYYQNKYMALYLNNPMVRICYKINDTLSSLYIYDVPVVY